MSERRRPRFFSKLALPVGVILIVLEIAWPRATAVEHWFWLVCGALLVLLGAAEYFGKPPTPGRGDPINPRLDE